MDARRIASFVNNGVNETELPNSLIKKWTHAKYGREKHLANKFINQKSNLSAKYLSLLHDQPAEMLVRGQVLSQESAA